MQTGKLLHTGQHRKKKRTEAGASFQARRPSARLRGVRLGGLQHAHLQPECRQCLVFCAPHFQNHGFALRQLRRERRDLLARGDQLLPCLFQLIAQGAAVRFLS